MDSPASRPQVGVPLHQAHQVQHCFRLKVNVSVQSQQERVVYDGFLLLLGQVWLRHDVVRQQVVHVHALEEIKATFLYFFMTFMLIIKF